MTPLLHEPRSVTILRHVNDYLLTTSDSVDSYADDIKNIFHLRVTNPRARVIQFHDTGEAAKDLKANGQLVGRIISRAVKFPDDMEEAFVLALPPQWRWPCIRDLCERYGMYAVPRIGSGATQATAAVARTMKEFSEFIEKLGPVLEDGDVDENDEEAARKALKEIPDVIAELLAWRERLQAVVPEERDAAA